MTEPLKHIVVVGGGLNAWTAAGMLARSLVGKACKITLLEPSQAPCDASAQPLTAASQMAHKMLGLKEAEIVSKANGTYSLGCRYVDWSDGVFHHTPNSYGMMVDGMSVADILTKLKRPDQPIMIDNYSLAAQAMRANRFAHPRPASAKQPAPMFAPYSYGLHVETTHYVELIKNQVLELIDHVIGDPLFVETHEHNGFIKAVNLANGDSIAADFFVDATPNSFLTAKVADGGYTDLSAQLGCDCCMSTFIESASIDQGHAQSPSVTMQSHNDGWLRFIPLQNKVLVEFYYSSKELSYDTALEYFIRSQNLHPQTQVSFKQSRLGRQSTFWSANCLSIGEAAGFIENLSVPAVHFVQSAILRFMDLYPNGFQQSLCDEFNTLTGEEYDRVMDFNTAHYYVAKGFDSNFWLRVKAQPLLSSLEHKLTLFKARGRFPFYERETFSKDTWIAFLLGHHIVPKQYDPLLDLHDTEKMKLVYQKIQHSAQAIVQSMPNHIAYTQEYVKAYQAHVQKQHSSQRGAAYAE